MWLKIHINANNIKKKSGFSVIIYLKVGCAVCLHKLCGKCHLMKACRHNLNLFRKFSCTKKSGQLSFWFLKLLFSCVLYFNLSYDLVSSWIFSELELAFPQLKFDLSI